MAWKFSITSAKIEVHFQKKTRAHFWIDCRMRVAVAGAREWQRPKMSQKAFLSTYRLIAPCDFSFLSPFLFSVLNLWVDPIIHFFHCRVLKKRNSVLKNKFGDSTWLSCPNTFQYKQPPKDFTGAAEIAIANWQAKTFSIFPRQVIQKANPNISILSNGEHIFGRPLCCNCHLMCCTTLYVPLIKKSDTV